MGIAIAAWSASGGVAGWIVLMVVALPVFAVIWFVGVATLSGALGNPF